MVDQLQSRLRLPVELIHEIVLVAIWEYIDELIAGSLAINHPGRHPLDDEYLNKATLRKELDEAEANDPALTASNPVLSLLVASSVTRDTALKVVSDILEIPLVNGRIKRCVLNCICASSMLNLDHRLTMRPWTLIHPTRLAFLNLHIVDDDTVSLAKTAAATSTTLRVYQLLGRCRLLAYAPCIPRDLSNFHRLRFEAMMDVIAEKFAAFDAASVSATLNGSQIFGQRTTEMCCATDVCTFSFLPSRTCYTPHIIAFTVLMIESFPVCKHWYITLKRLDDVISATRHSQAESPEHTADAMAVYAVSTGTLQFNSPRC